MDDTQPSCPVGPGIDVVLQYKPMDAGKQVKKDTELRILPVGDSITNGWRSEENGGNGDGYRRELRDDLSSRSRLLWQVHSMLTIEIGDKVVFAGTETSETGTMDDGYFVREPPIRFLSQY